MNGCAGAGHWARQVHECAVRRRGELRASRDQNSISHLRAPGPAHPSSRVGQDRKARQTTSRRGYRPDDRWRDTGRDSHPAAQPSAARAAALGRRGLRRCRRRSCRCSCRAPLCCPAEPEAIPVSPPPQRVRSEVRPCLQPMKCAASGYRSSGWVRTQSCHRRSTRRRELLSASASVTAAPPVTAIFLSLPRAKNPIHCPSGEKNGLSALSVPRSGSA